MGRARPQVLRFPSAQARALAAERIQAGRPQFTQSVAEVPPPVPGENPDTPPNGESTAPEPQRR